MQSRLPSSEGLQQGRLFPLVKTSFDFAGGLKLQSTLTRSCEAKG